MTFIAYRGFFDDLMAGEVEGADIRSILVMTNTTCDSEPEAQTFSDFDTVDEMDGSGYEPLDHTVLSSGWDSDDDRYEIHVDTGETFTSEGSLSAGTRAIQGVVVKRYVDGSGDDVPWFYSDEAPNLPLMPSGGEFRFVPAAAGFVVLRPRSE